MKWADGFLDLAPPQDDVMWTQCRAGHDEKHATSIVFPNRVLLAGKQVAFTVYDWERYMDKHVDYCPGQDVISQAIDLRGAWERAESALFGDILNTGNRDVQVVVDFGSQIGWYSTIAAAYGYEVAAVDVNAENCDIAAINIGRAATKQFGVFCGTVQETSPTLDVLPIRCVKIDIEGSEEWALKMLDASIAARTIDYLLIEISPVFNSSYPSIMQNLIGSATRRI